jgi:pimeloyl-ACP methyl ester carboxylesterase
MAVSGKPAPGRHNPGWRVIRAFPSLSAGKAGPGRRSPLPPGELVEAGGSPLHVVKDGAGRPPVVLCCGLGGTWLDWIPVVPLLAARHEVVRYDRPGLGHSPPVPSAPALRAEADRMAALVRALFPGEPVIVAAHSMAAFHAEAFARLYPHLIGGLVLVDPSFKPAPDVLPQLLAAIPQLGSRAGLMAGRAIGALGIARALAPSGRGASVRYSTVRGIDPVPPADTRAAYGSAEAVGATFAELACYRQQAVDLDRLREELPFPAVPLAVLAATGRARSVKARRRRISGTQQLARLAPGGRHAEIADSGHLISFDRPDAIASAVEEVTAHMARGTGDAPGNGG